MRYDGQRDDALERYLSILEFESVQSTGVRNWKPDSQPVKDKQPPATNMSRTLQAEPSKPSASWMSSSTSSPRPQQSKLAQPSLKCIYYINEEGTESRLEFARLYGDIAKPESSSGRPPKLPKR
jgi:hypothetical protein